MLYAIRCILYISPFSIRNVYRVTATELVFWVTQTHFVGKTLSPAARDLQRVPMSQEHGKAKKRLKKHAEENLTASEADVMVNWMRINSQRDKDEVDRREREAAEEEEKETLRLRRRGLLSIPTTRIMQVVQCTIFCLILRIIPTWHCFVLLVDRMLVI